MKNHLFWILVGGLVVQALALLVYITNSDKLSKPDPDAFPYQLTLSVHRSYPVNSLLNSHTISPDSVNHIVAYSYFGKTEFEFLNNQMRVVEQGRVEGNVNLRSNVWFENVDGDSLDDVIYTRVWPVDAIPLGGEAFIDSLWLCRYNPGAGEQVILRFTPERLDSLLHRHQPEPYRNVQFRSTTTLGLDNYQRIDNRWCISMTAERANSYGRALLQFERTEPPTLAASTETAVICRPGLWFERVNQSPLHVFGGSPPANGIVFPAPLASGEHVLLSGSTLTAMAVDTAGRYVWTREFGDSFGSVMMLPSDDDSTCFITVEETPDARTRFYRARVRDGALLDSLSLPSYLALMHSDAHLLAHPEILAMLQHEDGTVVVVDYDLNVLRTFTPPETFTLATAGTMWLNGHLCALGMQPGGQAFLIDLEQGKLLGTQKFELYRPGKIRGTFGVGEGAQAGYFLTDNGSALVRVEPNPNQLWWLWRYRWPVIFAVVPLALTLGLFFLALYVRGRRQAARHVEAERNRYREKAGELAKSVTRLEHISEQAQIRRDEARRDAANARVAEAQVKDTMATLRRRAGEQHLAQRQHLEAILSATEEGVAELDEKGLLMDANAVFTRIVGRPRASLRGRPVWEMLGLTDGNWQDTFVYSPGSLHLAEPFDAVGVLSDPRTGLMVRKTMRITLKPYKTLGSPRQLLIIHGDVATQPLEPIAKTAERLPGLITRSPVMEEVIQKILAAGRSTMPVVITGKTGTGKSFVAQLIHDLSQAQKNLVIVPLSTVKEPEDALFGHVKGAYTGAHSDKKGYYHAAHGGTLFLDDFLDAPLNVQAKLLRVVETGRFTRLGGEDKREERVNVRHIVATNEDLDEMRATGQIREDFYQRLNGMRIHLPSLRERSEDIPLLALHFLNRFSREKGVTGLILSEQAMDKLEQHAWEGNVRELSLCMKHAVDTAEGHEILVSHLTADVRAGGTSMRVPAGNGHRTSNGQGHGHGNGVGGHGSGVSRTENRREALLQALREADGVKSKAAERMGVSRPTLYKWMRKYGIEPSDLGDNQQ